MKGDRFTKIVDVVIERNDVVDCQHGYLSKDEAVRLLRKEHAAVVRMVGKHVTELNPTIVNETWGMGYRQACSDILLALARRAKGGMK